MKIHGGKVWVLCNFAYAKEALIKSHRGFNQCFLREQSISIKKLDTILREALKADSSVDRKNRHTVDGYTYFVSELCIQNILCKIILITRETHGKD